MGWMASEVDRRLTTELGGWVSMSLSHKTSLNHQKIPTWKDIEPLAKTKQRLQAGKANSTAPCLLTNAQQTGKSKRPRNLQRLPSSHY